MQKICQDCGTIFEGEEWKTKCMDCYKKSLPPDLNTDQRILRQVMLKIASEQNPNSTPEKIIEYAKKLEKEWHEWK